MITYIKGDLFAEKHPLIAHGCNCQGVMGSGVAKIVKEKFPQAYNSYRDFYEVYADNSLKNQLLGKVQFSHCGETIIANCFTQESYGKGIGIKFVSYDAVDKCMINIENFIEKSEKEISYVAMPKIGVGLGGGAWCVIEAIIISRLNNFDVKVYEL